VTLVGATILSLKLITATSNTLSSSKYLLNISSVSS